MDSQPFAPGPIRSPERISQKNPGQFAPWNFLSLAYSLPGHLVPLIHDIDARIPNDRRTLLLMRTCSIECG